MASPGAQVRIPSVVTVVTKFQAMIVVRLSRTPGAVREATRCSLSNENRRPLLWGDLRLKG
jgi:hypothetical protein